MSLTARFDPLQGRPEQPKWLCFHCGFGTSNEEEAGAHFGDRDDAAEFSPTCTWWARMSKEERVAEFQTLIKELNAARDESGSHAERIRELEVENASLLALLNTPETEDFDKAVPLEAAHQVLRWGAAKDAGKEPEDWFWLLGYLAGKALASQKAGDVDKAKHHCISSAAALRNWHAHLRSGRSVMRPGISEEREAPGDATPGAESEVSQ